MNAIRGRHPARLLLIVVLLAALGSTGCHKYGNISGKVTYQTKTVKAGNVYFYGSDGQVKGSAPIAEDGSYTANKVPVGEMTVCVDTDSAKPNPNSFRIKPPDSSAHADAGGAANYPLPTGSSERYVPIDKKYKDPAKSGKSYTVVSGNQEFNIDLD